MGHQLASLLEDKKATQDYYERNARSYFESTLPVDLSALYDRFLPHIPPGGLILDAGSGSGRDTLAFLKRGYKVEAFDASPALCALSTQLTGIRARVLRFQEFEDAPRYDGIWACASLLHVPMAEMQDSMRRLTGALKPGGALYMSFKYGPGERVSEDGRFYVDLDEPRLRQLFTTFPSILLAEVWRSAGEGTHQGRDEWLNAIALKAPEERSDQ